MTQPDREELAGRLEELAALEPGWYANVGKRTGERCCQAMREAAAALRQSPSVEEVASELTGLRIEAVVDDCRRDIVTIPAESAQFIADRLYRRGE